VTRTRKKGIIPAERKGLLNGKESPEPGREGDPEFAWGGFGETSFIFGLISPK
jgi:hypothetical protein